MTEAKHNNMKEWGKEAKFINLSLTMNGYLIKDFIKDVIKLSGLTKRLDLAEDAILCILANLYINYMSEVPTMIFGNKNEWLSFKRCGVCDWASLERVNAILEALLKMDYIDKTPGVYNGKIKFIAKYWIKDDCPILDILNNSRAGSPIFKVNPDCPIKVRDNNGRTMLWTDAKCNKKKTKKMIADINRYNKFLNQQLITFEISSAEIKDSGKDLINLFINLSNFVNTNEITLNIDNQLINRIYIKEILNSKVVVIITNKYNYILYRSNNEVLVYKYNSSIIDSIYYNSIFNSNRYYSNYNTVVLNVFYLIHIELSRYGFTIPLIASNDGALSVSNDLPFLLSGEIKYKTQQRIFNNGSFEEGGRFYGGAWTNLPKLIRDKFILNDEPVERLDYCGIHIGMLYCLEGIQFDKEVYVYSKEEDATNRARMKDVMLITINAKDKSQGKHVINKKLKSKGLYQSDYYTNKLIDKFESYHSDISKYMFGGMGIKLQAIDSTIIQNVLTKLTNDKIPALSVHDEIIFNGKYRDKVEHYMLDEYKKELGFTTTVD